MKDFMITHFYLWLYNIIIFEVTPFANFIQLFFHKLTEVI